MSYYYYYLADNRRFASRAAAIEQTGKIPELVMSDAELRRAMAEDAEWRAMSKELMDQGRDEQ